MAIGCSKNKPLESYLEYPHRHNHSTISLRMSAVLSPNPHEISTSVLLINADFCIHQGSTSTTAILIPDNHAQPVGQKQGKRGET